MHCCSAVECSGGAGLDCDYEPDGAVWRSPDAALTLSFKGKVQDPLFPGWHIMQGAQFVAYAPAIRAELPVVEWCDENDSPLGLCLSWLGPLYLFIYAAPGQEGNKK